MPKECRFSTTIIKKDGRHFVLLPFQPAQPWGERGRYDLTGTIGGHPYRGKVQPFADGYGLSLGPAYLQATGLEPGQEVEVVLCPEGPQLDNVGEDLRDALLSNDEARTAFEGLSTFCRKNYVRWIDEAKRGETRAKRIEQTVQMLLEGKDGPSAIG